MGHQPRTRSPVADACPEANYAQEAARIEDHLILAQYDEAATASSALVASLLLRGYEAKAGTLFQRALSAYVQAHIFSGRQEEVDGFISRLGIHTLAVQTFLVWVLLLLESGQAAAARLHVEQYMAAVAAAQLTECESAGCNGTRHGIACRAHTSTSASAPARETATPGSSSAPSGFGSSCCGSDRCSPDRCSPDPTSAASHPCASTCGHGQNSCHPLAGEGACSGAGGGVGGGAPAASLEDRAALARLYSQDVLTLGLGLPEVAMAWLRQAPQPSLPLPSPQAPQAPQAHTGCGVAKPAVVVTEGVISAQLLLGDEAAVAEVRGELEQLLASTGIHLASNSAVSPIAPRSSNSGSGSGGGKREGASGAAQRALSSSSAAGSGAAPRPHGPATATATAAATGWAHAAGASRHGGPSSVASPPGLGRLLRYTALAARASRLLAALQSWLAAAGAAVASIAASVAQRLTRAQAWAMCRAAAAAARLRALAAGHLPAGSGLPLFLLSGLLLLAALAEAPHLRAVLARQWAALAGMVREAVWMGLALRPSPVVTPGAPLR